MPISIDIEVDPAKAQPGIQKIGKSLGELVDKGKQVTDQLGRMKGADGNFVAMSGTADRAARAFGSLTDQFRREADMLERIHGPQREYMADLKALDMLLQKNAVSTQEYADQVTRLNQSIEKTPARSSETEAAGGGMVSSGAGMLAMAGGTAGVVAMGQQIEGLVRASEELADRYTETANRAVKFTDAGHNVNTILAEQQTLASALHAPLAATQEMYDLVREGSDEVNISHKEQIRLTQTLGEAVELSNKPLDAASGLMQKLSYAMATGSLTAREMKSIMKEFPELAHLWTDSFHVTESQLKNMVDSGKIGIPQLMKALYAQGAAVDHVDKSFGKLTKTHAQVRQEFDDRFAARFAETGDALLSANDEYYKYSKTVQRALDVTVEENEQIQRGHKYYAELAENLEQLTGAFGGAGDVMQSKYNVALHTTAALLNGLTGAAVTLAEKLNELGNGTLTRTLFEGGGSADLTKTQFGRQLGIAAESRRDISEARAEITALNAALGAGQVPIETYRSKYKSLLAVLNGGELPKTFVLLEEIQKPQRDWAESLTALDSLLKNHSITLDQYNRKVRQLSDSFAGPEFRKMLDALGGPTAAQKASDANTAEQAHNKAIGDYGFAIDERGANPAAKAADLYRKSVGQATAYVMDGEITQEQYNLKIRQLHDDYTSAISATDAFKDRQKLLQSTLDSIRAPMDNYRRGLEVTKQLLKDHAITAEQAANENEKLKKTFDEQDPSAKKLKATKELITEGLKPVEDELIKIAETGKTSWREMVDDMLHNAERLAISKLFQGGIDALFSGFGGGTSGDDPNGTGLSSIVAAGTSGGSGSSGGSSARMAPSGGGGGGHGSTMIVLNQDPLALLPTLQSPDGTRTISAVADRKAAVQARLRSHS